MALDARVQELAADIRSYPELLKTIEADARAANVYDVELYARIDDAHAKTQAIADVKLPTEVTTQEEYFLQKLAFIGTDVLPSFLARITEATQSLDEVLVLAKQYECLSYAVEALTGDRPLLGLKARPNAVLQRYALALPRAYSDYAEIAAEKFPNHRSPLESEGPPV